MAKGAFFILYEVEDAGEVASSVPTITAGPTGEAVEAFAPNSGLVTFKKKAFKEWGITCEEEVLIDRPKRCKAVWIEAESGKPEEACKILARVMGVNHNNPSLGLKSGAGGYVTGPASQTPKMWIATEANLTEKAAV